VCYPYWAVGVQHGVRVATVEAGGFRRCYSEQYDVPTLASDLDCSNSDSPPPSSASHYLYAAREAGSDTFLLLAMGVANRGVVGKGVANPIPIDAGVSQIETKLQNGVYWYNSQFAFGFSSAKEVYLQPADYNGTQCEGRLSWSIEGTSGGYRAGCTCYSSSACTNVLNLERVQDGQNYLKEVYYLPP